MKRHVVPILDFDTRANFLKVAIENKWADSENPIHRNNYKRFMAELRAEFGIFNFETKINDFLELGAAPLSIVGYHNAFFQQVRLAFIIGAYYPALTGACSLGERILNHLVLDLRIPFKATPVYKKIHNKDSFDDWNIPMSLLKAWGVLGADVLKEFVKLRDIRNRSIHFNAKTYLSARSDALAAIHCLHEIIDKQFGAFGTNRWFISGTTGACFISKKYESDPFVRTYYLNQCPPVGPYYSVKFDGPRILFFDRKDYTHREITDEEFKKLYETRKPEEVAPNTLPAGSSIAVTVLRFDMPPQKAK